MRAWTVLGAAMLVGVGVPGTDRVVPLPVYAAEQAADQAAKVLADMRAALGGAKVEQVKALSLEGPFRREMGPRQMEGTIAMVLQAPDRMHKSEDVEFPGGASIERIAAVANGTSWEDTQNRGGMGGGMRMMVMRGPDGARMDDAAMEKLRTARLNAEMQRWMLALLAHPAGEVTYAGVAESPDGKADTLEMKDARGQAIRLFVDQQTHLPLMLAFEEVRPRIMMQGGPGGRRGPGGPGGPGGPAGPGGAAGPGGPGPAGVPGPGGTAPGGAAAPPPDPHGMPVPAPGAGPGGQGPRRRGDQAGGDDEEIRRRIAEMPPPAPSAVRMSFAEYTTVDGVKVPTQITISVDGKPSEEWTVEKIKVNPSLKADFFEKK